MPSLGARLARGDETAFAELYDAAAGPLHHYLVRRLGSRHLASDVMQAAFMRAVEQRRRFAKIANPVGYLFQIARNESARAWNRERRHLGETLEEDVLASPSSGACCEENEVVMQALARMDENDRELVELKIYAGLTFQEIAQIVGLPQGTVATRYRRALESLRPWLTKQFL